MKYHRKFSLYQIVINSDEFLSEQRGQQRLFIPTERESERERENASKMQIYCYCKFINVYIHEERWVVSIGFAEMK